MDGKNDSIGDQKRLSSHPQGGVFITMGCEEILFGPQIIFRGAFVRHFQCESAASERKGFLENEKTQQLDVFEGPEPDARWRASWRSIGAAKPGFIV